jgi:hypothetical protein
VNSINNADLEVKKKKTSKNIFKISLSLVLIAFVFDMSTESYFQVIKPAEAAGLTNVSVVPTSGLVNQRTTYDIFLKTATTATIKTIEMTFPSSFDLTLATKYIERGGIGSGSLSSSGSTLQYTVNSPVSVPAGTTIRLEIARIIATTPSSSFTVSIRTLNTANSQIDGPTTSSSFTIKSISSNDVSPSFMVRKTLFDDAAGHAHGWNPTGGANPLFVSDSDISGSPDNIFVTVMVSTKICATSVIDTTAHIFIVLCNSPPADNSNLNYEIHKLPGQVVTSSLSVSPSSTSSESSSAPSFASSQGIGSISTQDETASEFP